MRTSLWTLPLAFLLTGSIPGQVTMPQGPAAGMGPETRPTREDTFTNFESTAVHPLRISQDGQRLYAVQTPDARLSVFSLEDPAEPQLLREVRVGLEPVSVTERTSSEVWVANLLSDTVTVLDPHSGDVIDVIEVEDEPSDIAFAGDRAFVTCATVDRVLVFHAPSRTQLASLDLPMKDPRAMAVSADGTQVLVLSRRSGNGTTVIPEGEAPAPPPPTNPSLPPAPQTALIVRADDPAFDSLISFTLPDRDVVQLDVQSLTISQSWREVCTTGYDLASTPDGGALVVGSDARNLVRFEPELRGHVVDHTVSLLGGAPSSPVTSVDLNPGIDYGLLPNPGALLSSLAEPTGVVLEPTGQAAWVTAHGSDRLARIEVATGAVLGSVDLVEGASRTQRALRMRGPRGLAHHPREPYLYVHTRLAQSLVVVETETLDVVHEQAIGRFDPRPMAVRLGAKFLYDARLSGNGTVSCAVCHVDGDVDGLAWDLGDPSGELDSIPEEWQQGFFPGSNPPNFPDLHPMKGPLMTQPLRGLGERLHWRGDQDGFAPFNSVFDTLMGSEELEPNALDLLVAWSESVEFPPNPNQNLDRSLQTLPPLTSQEDGFDRFVAPGLLGGPSCVDCHALPTGSNGFVRDQPVGSNQPMRIAPLRDYYRKGGFEPNSTGEVKAGFGRFHSGEIGELSDLGLGGGSNGSAALTAFLMAFDTGTAPAVGRQVFVTPALAGSPQVHSSRELLESRAALGELDLVAHGRVGGEARVHLFEPASGGWLPATQQAGVLAPDGAALVQGVASSGGWLVLLAVPPGDGVRLGRDRNLDGLWDLDE